MGSDRFQFKVHVRLGTFDLRSFLHGSVGPGHRCNCDSSMPAMNSFGIRWLRLGGCRRSPLIAVALLIGSAVTTFAHEGKPHTWHDLARAWSFEPVVVISLVATAGLFIWGLKKLWRQSGTGKGIRRWEAIAFAGGWFALFIALVSPVHAWGRVDRKSTRLNS